MAYCSTLTRPSERTVSVTIIHTFALLFISLFFSLTASAQSSVLQLESRNLQVQNSSIQNNSAQPAAITSTQTGKSRLEKAKEWGLTETEWVRYEEIMAGPRGVWSPNLDPLTALGVEARSDAERRHIAEVWVKIENDRTKRELAFELEHIYAQQRLFPETKPVQYSSQARSKSTLSSSGQKRLLFLAYKDCVDECRAPLSNLIKITTNDRATVLDVYVKGFESDDSALRAWAAKQQIPVQLVQSGRITLNHEGGVINRLQLTFEKLPLTLLRTADGKLSPFKG